MDIELNGQAHRATDNQSVQDLIDQLDLARHALAVAVNREVVPRNLWAQTRLQANDRVELVRPIGGG
jgi:sulfur carrier protein